MQAPPPSPIRLHWIPVPPSWLVAAGLVLLAALPHQVPAAGRRALQNPLSAAAIAAIAAWIAWRGYHVLAAAIILLIAGVWICGPNGGREAFVAPILNKDHVKRERHRWLSEEIMSEEPTLIQERTEGPALVEDEVHDTTHRWEIEQAMEEHPVAIQDRPVADLPEYSESHPPYRS